jgi:hypothetical protein
MTRGIAMLVSALVTAPAQAQDARMSKGEVKAVQAVHQPALVKIDQPQVVLASTTPMGNRTTDLPRSAPSAQPGAGPGPGASSAQVAAPEAVDCSVARSMLEDAPLTTRAYRPPKPPPGFDRTWREPPAVRRAAHCGDKYVIQVKSSSAEPWVLKAARLEGPNGTVLKVNAIQSRVDGDGWSFNVIMAEAPRGAGGEYPLHRLHLIGEDGRVAVLDQVVLP